MSESMADDRAEWTYVPAKKGRRNKTAPPANDVLSRPDKDASIQSLQAGLQMRTAIWLSSSARKQLLSTIKNLDIHEMPMMSSMPTTFITKAICLGIGNLACSNLSLRERSMMQLAVFLDVAAHLKRINNDIDLELFAQEPRFTATDKDFLKSLGIKVLDFNIETDSGFGPAAAHIDELAFVADFFVDKAVSQLLLDCQIGLFITALPQLVTETQRTAEELRIVECLKSSYRWYSFPDISCITMSLHGLYICGLQIEDAAV